MMKIEGSGSISQKHGSADQDPDPGPHQNFMDPQHIRNNHKLYYLLISWCCHRTEFV
jgi:hypothetical protein